jgi:two-component system NarL family sensor kinase
MERVRAILRAPSPAEAFAGLRIGGAIVIGLAAMFGPAAHGDAFYIALSVALVYAVAIGVTAVLGMRKQPSVALALIDVVVILTLIGLSGGARSEARLALVVFPMALGLAHVGRSIAAITAFAAAGFIAVSLPTLGDRVADTAFTETLAALIIVGAIGVALANVFKRRTAEIEQLGADRAALLHDALDAEERERARIGERLHDDALQSLLAARQDVREARGGQLESLDYADEALSDAVRALRETVRGLHPAALADRGLELALNVELDRVARRGSLAVRLLVEPQAVGPHDALLYAAARELLTNVVKHASATTVRLSLERRSGTVVLTVADDGVGIAGGRQKAALADGHVGLASTRHRIEAAGGALEVLSPPEGGTTVSATVPIAAADGLADRGDPACAPPADWTAGPAVA